MSPSAPASPGPRLVDRGTLDDHPVPQPSSDGDKEDRGRMLAVGGTTGTPGAMILAGVASLRAGAGKLQLATTATTAVAVGVAVPESMVVRLAEDDAGEIASTAADTVAGLADGASAVLVGPGMTDTGSGAALVRSVVSSVGSGAVVLDCAALPFLADDPHALHQLDGRAVLTPNTSEMAAMVGTDPDEVAGDPEGVASRAAAELRAIVALRGAVTWIAVPDGSTFLDRSGNVALATSGSGDVLAGLLAGLVARGAPPLHATLWAVHAHGRAGDRLAARVGRLGGLARELLDDLPLVLHELHA